MRLFEVDSRTRGAILKRIVELWRLSQTDPTRARRGAIALKLLVGRLITDPADKLIKDELRRRIQSIIDSCTRPANDR